LTDVVRVVSAELDPAVNGIRFVKEGVDVLVRRDSLTSEQAADLVAQVVTPEHRLPQQRPALRAS
jgi:hypothetical protein